MMNNDNIKLSNVNISTQETKPTKENTTEKVVTKKVEVIRGKPKSGRFWKSNKERFATINKTKGLQNDFQKKTALRIELKRTKELSQQLKEQLKDKELSRKQRRRDNIIKAEENRKKSEIVQVITNSAKIKRMKKKQLRYIQKRDTTDAQPQTIK